ncbi:hypothetical protein THTE_4209 [Thermogutta terrifontis]|uniref:Uncharacterized protein n=1 Tax=Thermogutta terrifontis TaxID=1331910 RepID=A0A286RLH5_9BACT|nr:hypothetical protein THTE_4209 [Thermogutta terrifontis]
MGRHIVEECFAVHFRRPWLVPQLCGPQGFCGRIDAPARHLNADDNTRVEELNRF